MMRGLKVERAAKGRRDPLKDLPDHEGTAVSIEVPVHRLPSAAAMTVLYLTEPGATLSATSRSLVVRPRHAARTQVPALGVQRVVVLAPTHVTSAALALCARESVELVVVPRGPGVLSGMGGSEAGLALQGAHSERSPSPWRSLTCWSEDPLI